MISPMTVTAMTMAPTLRSIGAKLSCLRKKSKQGAKKNRVHMVGCKHVSSDSGEL